MASVEGSEHICTNCGEVALYRFCAHCGQSTREVRVSLKSLLTEVFGSVFNIDSRFVRSIKPLLVQPGRLTEYFIGGRRAAFVSPVRLYLTCSLFFFVSSAYVSNQAAANLKGDQKVIFSEDESGGVNLFVGNGTKMSIDPPGGKKQHRLEKSSEGRSNDEKVVDKEGAEHPTGKEAPGENESAGDERGQPTAKEAMDEDPPEGVGADNDTGEPAEETEETDEDLSIVDRFFKKLEEKGKNMKGTSAAEFQRAFVPKAFGAASKMLVLLMPLFALFLKLLYVRRDPYYIDHLIFAVHFHCFLFVFYTLLVWWSYFSDGNLGLPIAVSIFVLSPLYLYKSLRRVYQQGRLKTMFKFCILSALYLSSLSFMTGVTVLVAFYTM